MEIQEIVEQLKHDGGPLPRAALQAAMEQPETITPHLLAILDEALQWRSDNEDDVDSMAHIYAIYLLAQFREPRALPRILTLCSRPLEEIEYLTGDFVTEDLGRVLGVLSHGDTEHLETLVEDRGINEWVRTAALDAFLVMVVLGELSREDVRDYFGELYHGKLVLEMEEEVVWTSLVLCTAQLHLTDLIPEVDKIFAEDLVDPAMYDREELNRDYFNRDEKDVLQREIYNHHHYQPIDNTIAELEWWATFHEDPDREDVGDETIDDEDLQALVELLETQQRGSAAWGASDDAPFKREAPKVGRNDPCSCGSGKKYKHCHGKAGR